MSNVMADRKMNSCGESGGGGGSRVIGSKVSQIANIFQNKANVSTTLSAVTPATNITTSFVARPSSLDGSHFALKTKRDQSASPKRHPRQYDAKKESGFREPSRSASASDIGSGGGSSQITVVRTESHVARFNSAKALFEKLGEDSNRTICRTIERIKRPSSVSSSHTSTESLISPRSPSPKNHINGSIFLSKNVNANGVVNGSANELQSPILFKSKSASSVPEIKQNGVVIASAKFDKTIKPEKPERKLNNKELIEKQRNWTSHFTKAKSIPKRETYSTSNDGEDKINAIACPTLATATVDTSSLSYNDVVCSQYSNEQSIDMRHEMNLNHEQNEHDEQLIENTEPKADNEYELDVKNEKSVMQRSTTNKLTNQEDVQRSANEEATTETFTKVDEECKPESNEVVIEKVTETKISVADVITECKMTADNATAEIVKSRSEMPNSPEKRYDNDLIDDSRLTCGELETTLPIAESSSAHVELDEAVKPSLRFFLGDTSVDSKMNSSSTVLCNSSISEEDSGFLSSEAIVAMRESDSTLLDNVKFADEDETIESEPICEQRIERTVVIESVREVPTVKLENVPMINTDSNDSGGSKESTSNAVTLPDTMTADEADNLLSARILEKKSRSHDNLLSDEEAQEVVHLLSPSVESLDKQTDGFWVREELAATEDGHGTVRNIGRMEDSLVSSNAGSISGLEDTYASSHFGSQTGSESGLLSERMSSAGSVDDLEESTLQESTLQDRPSSVSDDESTYKGFHPEPIKEIFEESGVHYFEDGHFWVEVPGLPAVENIEDLYHVPPKAKQKPRVKFSVDPIKVYSTFSMLDYDRRNEDVDPVAASAEYELEKRVEKLELLSVDLDKGPEGLGLSIIGMGVGADAGLEKLGIFVKTITDNGAAAKDRRIQVNDQIIEVDGKSLVGVTQAYAASVLRNTRGRVKFLIGREKDTENSEVAHLIRLSLQADKDREEQRRQMEQSLGHLGQHYVRDDTSLTNSYSSSIDDCASFSKENSAELNNADTLRRLLDQLEELEGSNATKEEIAEKLVQSGLRLREVERSLQLTKRDVSVYQGMLQQSQEQFSSLEKKYMKVKKLIKEFQQREIDFMHREEFYQQLLQEKDVEYNALVKALKDRIIQVEQELLETQKKAGFPIHLPFDIGNIKHVQMPQSFKIPSVPAVRPLLEYLEVDLSDIEDADNEEKTATVERKIPIKEELDEAIPQHELLDVSANKSKADLASRGGLANRQLPTASSGKRSGSLSNSSSEGALDENADTSDAESINSKEGLTDDKIVKGSKSTTNSLINGSPQKYKTMQTEPKQIIQSYPHYHRSIPRNIITNYGSLPTNAMSHGVQFNHNTRVTTGQHSTYSRVHSNRNIGPPPSLAEQLKQVLAERERRSSIESENAGGHDSHNEDTNRGAPNSHLIWQPAIQNSTHSSMSSGSLSPGHGGNDATALGSNFGSTDSNDVWCPSPQPQDSNSSDKKYMTWQNVSPNDWTKEQVCHWLIYTGLDLYVPKFLTESIDGAQLVVMENKDLKTLGLGADDRNKLKRKLKEVRSQIEKEKRHNEKERKEKEKLQKKAEKLAEKASRRK